eukprot:3431484-Amphidinium_carterae.2
MVIFQERLSSERVAKGAPQLKAKLKPASRAPIIDVQAVAVRPLARTIHHMCARTPEGIGHHKRLWHVRSKFADARSHLPSQATNQRGQLCKQRSRWRATPHLLKFVTSLHERAQLCLLLLQLRGVAIPRAGDMKSVLSRAGHLLLFGNAVPL